MQSMSVFLDIATFADFLKRIILKFKKSKTFVMQKITL